MHAHRQEVTVFLTWVLGPLTPWKWMRPDEEFRGGFAGTCAAAGGVRARNRGPWGVLGEGGGEQDPQMGEGGGVSGRAGGAAHPLGGAVCREHTWHLLLLRSGSCVWTFSLLFITCPNCRHTGLILVLYRFFTPVAGEEVCPGAGAAVTGPGSQPVSVGAPTGSGRGIVGTVYSRLWMPLWLLYAVGYGCQGGYCVYSWLQMPVWFLSTASVVTVYSR